MIFRIHSHPLKMTSHSKEAAMKYVILIGLALIVLIEYACMVASKRADEQAEELLRRYRESKDGRGIHSEE
jgi:hypothetical protein